MVNKAQPPVYFVIKYICDEFWSYHLKTQMSTDSIRKLSELYISVESGHLLLSTFPQA